MKNEQYEAGFSAGYEAAVQEQADKRYREQLQLANEDPTGQALDDFHERWHEPDNFDHIECPIQKAELQRGA